MVDVNREDCLTFGFCKSCNTTHSLPLGGALPKALELMDILEYEKRIDLSVPKFMANPIFSTDILWSDERGAMFGVLVGIDTNGNEVTLKGFSGQHNGEWSCDGWVEPLVDSINYLKLCREIGEEIKERTEVINSLNPSDERYSVLKTERKKISQSLMVKLHSMYQLHNFNGDISSLQNAFVGKGIPTGTGDCTAPKLLNAAAKLKITPTGLAEFYWGRENRSNTKQHKQFYGACENKCQPILGFLLCGLDGESSNG